MHLNGECLWVGERSEIDAPGAGLCCIILVDCTLLGAAAALIKAFPDTFIQLPSSTFS
jgi:hypothetical protein